MNSFEKGMRGEGIACAYLKDKGFRILERNYRWRGGELDIVADDGGQLVISEVKCWSRFGVSELARSVDYRKRRKIIATTRRYMKSHGISDDRSVRFDIVLVRGAGEIVRHIRGAFAEA